MFAVELAAKLEGTNVTSNLLHPGGVRTNIMREMPWLLRSVINLFFIDVKKGARTNIMLASDPELENISGKYFDQCEPDDYGEIANDDVLRQRLWDASQTMTQTA